MFISIYRTKDQRGFSMIEGLIAIALFSIGSLAVLTLYYSTTRGIRTSDDASAAMFVAQSQLNTILSTQYIPANSNVTASVPGPNYNYTVTTQITSYPLLTPIVDAVPNTVRIQITVSWPRTLGGSNTTTLSFIRAETNDSAML